MPASPEPPTPAPSTPARPLPQRPRAFGLLSVDVPDAGPMHVLVVAGDPLAGTALTMLLEGQKGFAVVARAAGEAAVEAALARFRPDVVLWDLGWGGAAGAEVPDLRAATVPVVLLLPDELSAPEAWQAGARALLLREAAPEALLTALAAVQQGLVALDPGLAEALLPTRDAAGPFEDLTPREHEVLQHLGEGLPNKLIADRLGISEHTVKFHVNAILGKLGAHSRTEAVTRAARIGLLIL